MTSKKEVDAHLAAALRRLRAVATQTRARQQIQVRTVQPGPNALRGMSVGLLAAEMVRQVVRDDVRGVERVATEFERRDFDAAAREIRTPSQHVDDEVIAEVDFFDGHQAPNIEAGLRRSVAALDEMAAEVDEIELQPLSNREVVEDLEAVGAPQEMVDAYVMGIGVDNQNPAEIVQQQLDSGEKLPLSFTNALDATIGNERVNDLTQ